MLAVLPASWWLADCQSDVIERRHSVAVFGLESGKADGQVSLVGAVSAVLSDHQAPAHGLNRAVGIGVAERDPVGVERV